MIMSNPVNNKMLRRRPGSEHQGVGATIVTRRRLGARKGNTNSCRIGNLKIANFERPRNHHVLFLTNIGNRNRHFHHHHTLVRREDVNSFRPNRINSRNLMIRRYL